ncbi:hypothetical protein [Sphingobium sp.]|uniref:hypothetical protein n=1 Tax=Sphingobium sp. TaxID=1912891 RepID=UPI003B3B79D8
MPDYDFREAIEEAARAEQLKKQTAMPVDHGAELRRRVVEAIKAVEQEYRASNPGAAAYGLSSEIRSYVKRPRSFSGYAHQMVDLFLAEPSTLRWSNERLASSVERSTGFKAPKSLLTERLTAAQKRKVEAVLGQRAISLDLKKYNTMSKIKGALLANFSSSDAKLRFTGSIAITDDAVIVNGKRRAIQRAKVNRIHVGKRHWLNVDALVEWLQDE